MIFINPNHEREFNCALTQINRDNFKLISAIYLLTADYPHWRRCRFGVEYNAIDFERISLGSLNEKSYALLVCAKNLYLGTKHLTITDLCDEQIVSDKLFRLVCMAMRIRKYGFGLNHRN